MCVFAGAATGHRRVYAETARAFGALLARRGLRVVTGGGRVGLMGAVADGALGAGGQVLGIIPGHLVDREVAHPGLTDLRTVGSMHERKAQMVAESDAFVALPGGAGTLDELFEVFTWSQLGLHDKPCAVLDVDGFGAPLGALLDHLAAEGFVRPHDRARLPVLPDAESVLAWFDAYVPPPPRWGPPAG